MQGGEPLLTIHHVGKSGSTILWAHNYDWPKEVIVVLIGFTDLEGILVSALQVGPGRKRHRPAVPPPPIPVWEVQTRIPLLLWPLIAINAPFAACPRSLRRLLGGISVATFLTSVGAIVCVTLLKKHH